MSTALLINVAAHRYSTPKFTPPRLCCLVLVIIGFSYLEMQPGFIFYTRPTF
jgi:hypothetical protein